jgi:hypothetical protein
MRSLGRSKRFLSNYSRRRMRARSEQEAPVHAPPHCVSREMTSGAAESATLVPSANIAEQQPGQSMPAGAEVTRPPPFPVRKTFSARGGIAVKVANTPASVDMRTRHEEPLQAPPNPEKAKPAAGTAVNCTTAVSTKLAEQDCGQVMPAGALVTEAGHACARGREKGPRLPAR